MEEASVAGESPDRSKQRESSAEPTSGSAGPVPEARTGSRDPRLSVAREENKPSTARGGVDTATKVFSVRDLPKDATDAPAPVPTPAPEPEGEAPLREAVVTRGAGPEDEKPTPETGSGSGTGAEAEGASTPAPDKEVVADANSGADANDGAEAAGDSGGTADGNGNGNGNGNGKDDAEAEAEAVAEVEPPAEAEDKSAETPAAGAGAAAETPAAVDKAGDNTEDAAGATEAEDATGTTAPAPAGANPKPETDAEPEPKATDADADAAPGAAAAAAADDASRKQPATDDESRTADAGEADEAEGGAEADEAEAEAEGERAPEPAAPVDHPTAIFKAVRPPEPEGDQPTTMLKLGSTPTPTDSPKADETPKNRKNLKTLKAPESSESEAERISRFVALKPLDERRAQPDATRPVPQVGPERTTQQPLPPKPPLDLLAELTNTPPPPETPVRTIVRRVKIWTPLVLLLAIVLAVVQAVRPLPAPSLTLTADDSYTFGGKKAALPWPSEGQGWLDVNGIGTMGNFGKQTPVAIGSVAKAMTAYLVLKDHPLKTGSEGAKIKVDATAQKEGGYDKNGESTLNTVQAGDVLTEKQALSAVMIPSANNIARLLARWDAGSETAFIRKMNATAKKLGMTHTTYTDASGLKESTVSTSEDQVKLGNELVKIPALMDITKLPSWTDPSGHKWRNYNELVPYNGAIGIKTGTTTAAGGNLLFAATKAVGGETVTVVGAILGQHTAPIIDTVNTVSRTAMLGAQSALTSAKILKKGDVVGYVDDQLGNHTPVVLTKDVAAVGWAGLKVKLSFDADAVPHTAKAGTQVGTLTVGDGSSGAVKVPVALQKDLAEPGLSDKLTRLG
ncbi:D-alanyl-D-alanine carboxypeptidase [Streptomyces sp. NPDC005423]|uniref:D-alanyl-D-alanine carboxypeptidase family protein n=1 Tax=Streptomyces sp. NPDC005423 TaxID=3155343 RepID=UPI0033A5C073